MCVFAQATRRCSSLGRDVGDELVLPHFARCRSQFLPFCGPSALSRRCPRCFFWTSSASVYTSPMVFRPGCLRSFSNCCSYAGSCIQRTQPWVKSTKNQFRIPVTIEMRNDVSTGFPVYTSPARRLTASMAGQPQLYHVSDRTAALILLLTLSPTSHLLPPCKPPRYCTRSSGLAAGR